MKVETRDKKGRVHDMEALNNKAHEEWSQSYSDSCNSYTNNTAAAMNKNTSILTY